MSGHSRTRVSAQTSVSTQALVSAKALQVSGNAALGDETRGEQGFERVLALIDNAMCRPKLRTDECTEHRSDQSH
jgi:hypothetical protein